MNLVVLMGNLTQDPELSTTNSGKSVCKFSLAVNRDFEEGTDFFNCTAWGTQADNIAKFFKKGKKILINGRIKITDSEKDGNKRRFTDIIISKFEFCGNKDSDSSDEVKESYDSNSSSYTSPISGPPLPVVSPVEDTGLPF
jgi:single-strand DNA-binding protein